MPHMMPMFWTLTFSISLLTLLFSISLFYFMKLTYSNHYYKSINKMNNKFLWNWKW